MMTVISLGAGVQSTTMALMAAHGEIRPLPDCAVFSDTGAEPAAVYDHLAWLQSPNVLPFPIHVVSAGNLYEELMKTTRGEGQRGSHARPPFFVKNADGSRGIIRRQCTSDFKIDPIERKVRELLGLKFRQRWPRTAVLEQWIGISLDEKIRCKPSSRRAIRSRWPLIEKRMSRSDCLLWIERKGYPVPPKSACTFCPYRSDVAWRHLRDTDAAGWAQAIEVDEAIRDRFSSQISGQLYLHDSLRALAEIDLSTAGERGQTDLFLDECQGMCGS